MRVSVGKRPGVLRLEMWRTVVLSKIKAFARQKDPYPLTMYRYRYKISENVDSHDRRLDGANEIIPEKFL